MIMTCPTNTSFTLQRTRSSLKPGIPSRTLEFRILASSRTCLQTEHYRYTSSTWQAAKSLVSSPRENKAQRITPSSMRKVIKSLGQNSTRMVMSQIGPSRLLAQLSSFVDHISPQGQNCHL